LPFFRGEICPQAGIASVADAAGQTSDAGRRGPPRFYPSLYSGKTPETEQPCSAPGFFYFRGAKILSFKRPASHRGKPGHNKERTMNKKHGFLFGIAVIAIAAIFTLTGCPTEADGGGSLEVGGLHSDPYCLVS
jgi:hypothetical protein